MLISKLKIFCILIFIAISLVSNAQVKGKVNKTEQMSYWEGAIHIGTSIFMGDIKYYRIAPAKGEWRFTYGISFGRRLSALIGIRGTLLVGKLSGRQKTGNHSMESHFDEINLSGMLYLDNLFGEHRFDRFVQPYLIAGTGLVYYNTNLYTQNPDELVKNSGNQVEGLLLLGLGIDFRINRQWSVSLESANRGMLSDYMDLWKSGFPYDVYNITSAGIKYRFGYSSNSRGSYPQITTRRKVHRAF